MSETATSRRFIRVASLLCAASLAALAGCQSETSSPDASQGSQESAATGQSATVAPETSTTPPTPSVTEPVRTQKFSKLDSAHGEFLVTDFAGPASGVTMKVWVWLPPQYFEPEYAGKRFPVIYGFPGGEGIGYHAWFTNGQMDAIAKGAEDGTITPFIIVEPELQVSLKEETECTDLPGHPKVSTFMDTDVPEMVKSNFRVLTSRTAWGLAGSSTGAYCAAKYLLYKPEQWATAVLYSPYFTMDSHLKAGQTKSAIAMSPSHYIKTITPPDVEMVAFVGDVATAEKNSMKYTTSFMKDVKPLMKFELRHIPGGKHSWATYRQHTDATLKWFTKRLDKPS